MCCGPDEREVVLRFSLEARDLIDFGVHTVVCSNSAEIKRPRNETDLSEPPSATIKIMWNFIYIYIYLSFNFPCNAARLCADRTVSTPVHQPPTVPSRGFSRSLRGFRVYTLFEFLRLLKDVTLYKSHFDFSAYIQLNFPLTPIP
jgi:hypothetical protein